MSLVVDHHEVAAGPGLVDSPRRIERAAEVEPSVDQPPWDPRQSVGIADDLVRLEREEGLPRIVVRRLAEVALARLCERVAPDLLSA